MWIDPARSDSCAILLIEAGSRASVVAEVLQEYLAGPHRDEELLLDKRLGYLFEALGLDEELFAEKIRAMGERSRPRDLYDIVNLFRREDLRLEQELIRSPLDDKCESRGIAMPTHADISSSPLRAELESEWENMLGHQLPVLPPFEQFWEEAEVLFQWLEGNAIEEPVEPIGAMTDEDRTWSPPPTLETWGRASLEVVRFAGVNHLLVELGYNGSTRLVEPYSLRRSLPRPLGLLRQDGLGGFTPSGPLVRGPGSRGLAPLRFHVGGQLLRLTEKTATPSALWSFPLVMCHQPKATRRLGMPIWEGRSRRSPSCSAARCGPTCNRIDLPGRCDQRQNFGATTDQAARPSRWHERGRAWLTHAAATIGFYESSPGSTARPFETRSRSSQLTRRCPALPAAAA